MDNSQLKMILIGLVSGTVSYWAYSVSNIFTATVVFLLCGWILFNLRSGKHIWGSLGKTKMPLRMAIIFLFVGLAYAGIRHYTESQSIFYALGVASLAGVVSIIAYNYWNIGP